jgi:hypothetical protein
MDKPTRISRIVRQFLRGRFSASTEERVQRWLADPRDAEEKEAASLEFWDSLDPTPDLGAHRSWKRVAARAGLPTADQTAARSAKTVPMRRPFVRRVAGIAASILIPLMAVAGGLIWRADVRERAAEAEIAAVQTPAAEVKLAEPLMFEGAGVGEIFTALEERFGVTIEASETLLGDPERYTVKFPRGDSLDNILNVLTDVIGEFEYKKSEDKITIINK